MIELRLIRNALALGQYRNFARAAEALGLTQPSLSRSIAALEKTLGVALFDRSPKGVTPTAFGRLLLEGGQELLRREANLCREVQLLAGLATGSLSVGAGPYASEISVATAVARVVTAHPQLQIQFSTADPLEVVRDVLAERIDVGVAEITDASEDQRLQVETLPSHRIILACRPGHPLSRVVRPSLVQVLGFPLVTTRLLGAASAAASGPDSTAQPTATAKGFIPQVCVNSLVLARLIARDSDALFPGTLGMLADDLAAGRLTLLDFAGPAMRTNYGLIYLRGRTLTPAARMFIDTLRVVESEARNTDAQPAFAAGMVPQQRSPAGKRR